MMMSTLKNQTFLATVHANNPNETKAYVRASVIQMAKEATQLAPKSEHMSVKVGPLVKTAAKDTYQVMLTFNAHWPCKLAACGLQMALCQL